jgi:hypothetical protein
MTPRTKKAHREGTRRASIIDDEDDSTGTKQDQGQEGRHES